MGILDNNKTEADGNDVFDFAFAPLSLGNNQDVNLYITVHIQTNDP